jgi:hypothetical protein
LADRGNGNFSYPSNPSKRNKHDFLNMTSRGKSHIGFGSSDIRGPGVKLNMGYKDMDSLVGSLNKKPNDSGIDT